jgi:hypothetical protein
MKEADLPGSTPSFQKRNVHVSSTIPKEGRLGHWGQGTIGTLGTGGDRCDPSASPIVSVGSQAVSVT